MDNFRLFMIENVTNMHVGNGDINFNIIDNEVQRDVLTNFPTINSSSLKGAIKEFCKIKLGENDNKIKYIFGDGKEVGIGKYKFFGASLLSIPVRSNVKPFFRATCPLIIREFINTIEDFEVNLKVNLPNLEELEILFNKVKEKEGLLLSNNYFKELKVEGYKSMSRDDIDESVVKKLEKIFGVDLVIFNDDVFENIVKNLPIIARNKLENGTSKNLWYEEVVPRKTRFYFGVIQKEYAKEFNKLITKEIVQLGANATIGYGYCKIIDMSEGDIDG